MAHRKTPSSPHQNRTRAQAREHHRAQRQESEDHELERRATPPARRRGAPFWKFVRRVIFILLLAGLVELVVASLTAPQFQVAEVTVSGDEITPRSQVIAVQQSLVGQNWIRANTGAAVEQLAALPTIKSVRIARALHWPPHLHIFLTEREPFACVGAGQEWWVVDADGVPFRPMEKDDEKLYALTGPNFSPVAGQALPARQWQPAARLVNALSAKGNSWPLRRIYFDKNDFVSLRLEGGFHDEMLIRLGGDRWEAKLKRAQAALEYFERTQQRAKSLNLVSYNMPQWTPLQPAPTSANAAVAPDA